MKFHVEIANSAGLILRGYVNVPLLNGTRFPTVIMLHGFTGHKAEGKFLFARTAALLEAEGFCVLRFDFAHSGESDGSFEFMTPSGEVEDTVDIIKFAQGLPYVESDKIALLGYSLGAYIASIAAARLNDQVKTLVLWSPGGNFAEVLSTFFSGTDKDFYDFEGLPISRKAYEDALKTDVYGIAKEYSGKVLIVHETGDEVVPFAYAEKYKEIYGKRGELFSINFKGHAFENMEVTKQAIAKTLEFLIKTLK